MAPKKRKAEDTVSTSETAAASNNGGTKKKIKSNETASNNTTSTSSSLPGAYQALSLVEIKDRITALMDRVPTVDKELTDSDEIYNWAATLQAVIEEFNLLVCLIAAATYKWGTDRSGAADQNLTLLGGELQASQEQISSTVTPRLTNILAPVVDLVIDKSIVTKQHDNTAAAADKNNNTTTTVVVKTKQNVFTQKQVDPNFLDLCRKILQSQCRDVATSVFGQLFQSVTVHWRLFARTRKRFVTWFQGICILSNMQSVTWTNSVLTSRSVLVVFLGSLYVHDIHRLVACF